MAQYLGSVTGSRSTVSRLGGKSSGLDVRANGWHLGARAVMVWNEEKQLDEIIITLTSGSGAEGKSRPLGRFTAEDLEPKPEKIETDFLSKNDLPAIGSEFERDGKKYRVIDNACRNVSTAERIA